MGTGPGNSGGPVWVRDAAGLEWKLGGVLVSGSDLLEDGSGASIGVVALDASARSLVQAAVRLAQSSEPTLNPAVFSVSGLPLAIPDFNRNGVTVEIPVSVPQNRAGALAVGIRIIHSYSGDLEITLRAPGRGRGGKSLLLARPVGLLVEDFEWTERPVQGFENVNPKGVWRLTVRDLGRYDLGTLVSATLFVGRC